MIASEPSLARVTPPETGASTSFEIARGQILAERARADRIGRTHVDDERARLQVRGERAALHGEQRLAHLLAGRQHGDDGVAGLAELGELIGRACRRCSCAHAFARAGSRSKATTSKPPRFTLAAIGAPILPMPMKPTVLMSVMFLNLLETHLLQLLFRGAEAFDAARHAGIDHGVQQDFLDFVLADAVGDRRRSTCTFNSLGRAIATSMASVIIERILRDSFGRVQVWPKQYVVTTSCIGQMKSPAASICPSAPSWPHIARRTSRPRAKSGFSDARFARVFLPVSFFADLDFFALAI